MKVSKIVAIVIWSLVAILLTVFLVFAVNGNWAVSYTHLTLPTKA